MDRGTDELLASGTHDSADSDDEPLIKIKTALAAKPPEGKGKKSSRSKGTNKKTDVNLDECSDSEPPIKVVRKSCKPTKMPPKKSVKSDKKKQDSDDKLLIKMETSALTKKAKKKQTLSKSNGTNDKKADLTTDSSDDEPLIKIARVSSKAAKKSSSVPPRDCIDKKKGELSADSDDSDDEPLSELAKKLKARQQKKAPAVSSEKEISVLQPKRNRSRKIVKYAESSSNNSDYDEPLATIKKKSTKAVQDKKTTAGNKTKTKCTYRSLEDSLDKSSDDDVPLVKLMKMKPLKKNAKTTTVSQGSASRKRQGVSDESSDDEPLVNLTKKNQMNDQMTSKTKASAPKKRETPPKEPIKIPLTGLPRNSSVGEPLIKSTKHPQVTKIVRILLERCDGENAGPTGGFNKIKTEAPIAEKLTTEETSSEYSATEDE